MDLPEEKPVSLYLLMFFLFAQGSYLCFFSGDYCSGFWLFLAVVLGVAHLFALWALFSGVPRAHVWAMNVYCAFALYCFVGGVGGIPLPPRSVSVEGVNADALGRWVYIFGIVWSMAQVLAFSRQSIAVWYRPRVRRGYYISHND